MASCIEGWTEITDCKSNFSCNTSQVCSTLPVLEYTWYEHKYV